MIRKTFKKASSSKSGAGKKKSAAPVSKRGPAKKSNATKGVRKTSAGKLRKGEVERVARAYGATRGAAIAAPKPEKLDPVAEFAMKAAEAAFDKKAFDVVVLDVRGLSPITDMLVIASARSTTHLRAVADNVEKELALLGTKPTHRERGLGNEPDWILLDFVDLMVHVFLNDVRGHYSVETLHPGAKKIAEFHGL